MRGVPASNTRNYRTGESDSVKATYEGLYRYFNMVLKPTIEGKEISRFIFIDHSASGQSVDGFYKAFLDSILAYWAKEDHDKGIDWEVSSTGLEARAYYSAIPKWFINLVDYNRRPDGKSPAIEPLYVKLLDTITVGKSGDVNKLVGDKKAHDRVTPDYPVTKWEIPTKKCWASKEEQEYAAAMKDSIVTWNPKNGGQIDTPKPKSKTPLKNKFMPWNVPESYKKKTG
jgi:hypothetical protein